MIRYAIALALAAACLASPAFATPTSPYVRGICPDTVAVDERIECGDLTVPENRGKPDSRTLSLPVMIFHSRSAAPAPDPVIFLPGGPGGSSVANKHSGKQNPFIETRDYILLEPRGAKMATPALDCPGINAVKGEISAGHHRTDADAILIKAAAKCRADLTGQGIDLDGYTSAETAQDIEDLRVALGIGQWNVIGHSYGTRLALTYLRDHPQGIRSVLLDSVLPPEANFDESATANLWRALHVVFDNCATSSACHAAYPHLPQDFAALIEHADRAPLNTAPSIRGSDNKPVTSSGAEVVDAIYSALHNPDQIGQIPAIIEGALAGRTDKLAALIKDNQGPSSFTWGLRLSIWCAEEMPFEKPSLVEAQTSADWGLGGIDERTASVGMCQAWHVAAADAKEAAPVVSDVPVLVMSGEFDPDTPPDWGRSLTKTMPNARVVLMPGRSHGAGFNRCGGTIELAFINEPKAALDTSCALSMRGADMADGIDPN